MNLHGGDTDRKKGQMNIKEWYWCLLDRTLDLLEGVLISIFLLVRDIAMGNRAKKKEVEKALRNAM